MSGVSYLKQVVGLRCLGHGCMVMLLIAVPGSPVLAVAWCLAAPTCLGVATRLFSPDRQRALVLVESLVTGAALAATAVPVSLLVTAGVLLVGGASALGGLLHGIRAAMLATGGALLGSLWDADSVIGPSWLPVVCLIVVGLNVAALAHVAWVRGDRDRQRVRHQRDHTARLVRYLPEPVRDDCGRGRSRVQRCWLTVGFVDLEGFAAIAETLDPEEVNVLLDRFIETAASTAHTHGGYVAKLLGDGALLVFEQGDRRDAADRARACCRDLLAELQHVALALCRQGTLCSLRARAAIASGFCAVGDWGAGDRLEFTVIGRAVNLASRLQQHARTGEVLMCERTAHLLGHSGSADRVQLQGIGTVSYARDKGH